MLKLTKNARSLVLCTAAALALTTAAHAQQMLIPENQSWHFLHPMGTLPPRPDTTPDPDFETTWYLRQPDFLVNYDGPRFDAGTTGNPAVLDSADSGPAPGPFAYGGVDSIPLFNTVLTTPAANNRFASYYRTTFTVPAGGLIEPELRVSLDDGGYLYLDGVLIATVNINAGVADTYTSFASDATNTEVVPAGLFTFHLRSAGLQPGATPGDVNVLVPVPALAEGEHTLALSVHNNNGDSSDMGMFLELYAFAPATCTLHAAISDVVRDFKGTPLNTADDEFSFKVTMTGSNTGATWSSDNPPTSGPYGTATTMGPYSATGPATVTFTAAADPLCQRTVTVDPPSAFTTLVDYTHTWKVMNPLGGVLPPRPAGGADTDFETTWYLKENNFLTQYDGPTFGAGSVAGSVQAVTGPGPFEGDNVDGIGAGLPVGPAGTVLTVPTSGSRRTSYYRTTFTNTEPINIVTFDLLCDDGVFIYLDGNLVAKEHMTAGPGFMSLATNARDENLLITIDMSQPPGANVLSTVPGLAPGEHTLAVSLHQSATNSSDMGLALKMSGIEVTGQCLLEAATSNVIRSEAGTPGNPVDDTYTFDVTVNGANAGATWNSNSNPASGNYGVATAFGPFAVGGGSTTVIFTSAIDPACTTSVTVAPPPCTMSAVVSNIARDGAATPADPRDDTFSFDVTVTGTFLSTQWAASQAPASGAYNVATRFGPFPATSTTAGAAVTVTFNDSVDVACTAAVTVQPPRYVPPVEMVPYSHVWKVMNPLAGVVPNGPGGFDADFDTTWFLSEPDFVVQYDGPAFGTGGVAGSHQAIEGPGPFAAGGIDGLAAGMTIGPVGTPLTLPATDLRYSSYYRTTFTTTELLDNLKFDVLCDDGVFIYLDGVLVAQENMPGADTYTALATAARAETLITTIDLSAAPGGNVMATVSTLSPGTHTLAVSLHQSSITSSDMGLALTLYGRVGTGCVVSPVVSNVTRTLNNTASPADDMFSFSVNVTATNGGPGWTSNAIPASGTYGVPADFGPLSVSEAPKSITFTDTADLQCRAVAIAALPPVFGTKSLDGSVSAVLPSLPIPANWTANGSTISHSTNIGVAAPGSVMSSEVVDLSAVAGPVQFRMDLVASENSAGSNFEDGDTVLVELVLNDGVAEQRINLITPWDTNGNGVLNGFSAADAPTYNLGKAADELNGSGVDAEAFADHTFALSRVISDNIVSAQVVVTVVAVGGTETITITNASFSPSTVDVDTDGDGQTDASEGVAGTNANDPNDFLHITSLVRNGAGADITFPSKIGRNYQAEVSNRLTGGWTAFGGVIAGTDGPISANIPQVPLPGESKYFLRIRVVP